MKTFRALAALLCTVSVSLVALASGADGTATAAAAAVDGLKMIHFPGEIIPLSEGAYKVSVENASAPVGEKTAIVVKVKAGDGFKCNSQYPNKIKKLSASSGATVEAGTVKGTIEGKSIVYTVGVTANETGTHSVTGEIRFSVCNKSSCHIKKVPLEASVTGK